MDVMIAGTVIISGSGFLVFGGIAELARPLLLFFAAVDSFVIAAEACTRAVRTGRCDTAGEVAASPDFAIGAFAAVDLGVGAAVIQSLLGMR